MVLSENIKKLRINKGAKQIEVAHYLNISQPAYANYENNIRVPDIETLIKLANFFDVSVDELIGRTESTDLKDKKDNIVLKCSSVKHKELAQKINTLDNADLEKVEKIINVFIDKK